MNMLVLIGVGCLGIALGVIIGRGHPATRGCRDARFDQAMPGLAAIRADIAALPRILSAGTSVPPASLEGLGCRAIQRADDRRSLLIGGL
jgi:hypothetical protein